ncbi:MAG TPA: hypothetical protein VEQ34_05990, partial [Pyrinomonadaceae bacterium]|nr:hypothetical protein [Pyrinomonadaceae bacterium]
MSSGTEIKQADVFERIAASDEFRRLFDEIRRGSRIVSLAGLTSGAAKACVLAALQKETGKTFVVVSETNKDLEDWNGDLCFFSDAASDGQTDKGQILILPSSDADPYAGVSPHAETLEQRALTLWRMSQTSPDFLLLTARALVAKSVAPEELRNLGAYLRREEDFAPEELIEKLVACGYVREEPVAGVGQFSSRGGIVDVWSPDAELPVR